MNQGAATLVKVCSTEGTSNVARTLGVSVGMVCNWKAARHKPDTPNRIKLEKSYGVGLEDWEKEPS